MSTIIRYLLKKNVQEFLCVAKFVGHCDKLLAHVCLRKGTGQYEIRLIHKSELR